VKYLKIVKLIINNINIGFLRNEIMEMQFYFHALYDQVTKRFLFQRSQSIGKTGTDIIIHLDMQ
jgi:hypothetical protein